MRQSASPTKRAVSATSAMAPEGDTAETRERVMYDSFSHFLAMLFCTRTNLFIKSGQLVSLLGDAPPTFDPDSPFCQSCGRRVHSRVLCVACAAKAPLLHKATPLIDTMFRSSNPAYAIDANRQRLIDALKRMLGLAERAYLLAEKLSESCWTQYRQLGRPGNTEGRNVVFTREMAYACGTYSKYEMLYVTPMKQRVYVGGLGLYLRATIKQCAIEWLLALDAAIREHLCIPLSRPRGDNSLQTNLETLASLIASRVSLLEPNNADPSQRLCSLGCEHLARIQYVRCHYYSYRGVGRDVMAMRLLVRLLRNARDAEDDEADTEYGAAMGVVNDDAREGLLALLRAPAPELLCALPDAASQMHFARLRDALGSFPSVGLERTAREIGRWRDCVEARGSAEGACLLVERAIAAAQGWRPPAFVPCLQRGGGRAGGAGAAEAGSAQAPPPVPPMTWVELDPTAPRWRLVSAAAHRQRRTGLDPTGERIVLLAHAVMQLDACNKPQFFRAGCVRCEVLQRVLMPQMVRDAQAANDLKVDLDPQVVGVEWDASRKQMLDWQDSHIDEHVRLAFSLLGNFSYDELSRRFGKLALGTPGYSTLRTTVQELMLTNWKLRPAQGYETWLAVGIELALPMLLNLRQGLGFGPSVHPNREGDILRLLVKVRDWRPSDGPLHLSPGEVYDTPAIKHLLIEDRARGGTLAKRRKIGKERRDTWVFEPARLEEALGVQLPRGS